MISLFGSWVGKEELGQIAECFDKQWIGIGPKVAEFEKQLAARLGVPDLVLLNSGSNSLHMAVKLLDLPEGSEVILPTFTWISCASAIQLNRLKPVFCDVDLNTCNMRPSDVREKVTSKTAAVMVVHYAGKPVDMDGIRELGFPIIEDAAHAIDSTYKNKACGTLGDTAIFSFDAVKNLTTGEGGAVLSRDPSRLKRARALRYCGIAKSGFQASASKDRWWEYDIQDYFPKMLPNDIAAGIGLAQLQKLDSFQNRRKQLWTRYQETLSSESWSKDWLALPPDPERHERHSYFTYCVRLKHGSRDKLAKHLYDRGVYSSLRFHPLHLNAIYGNQVSLPNSELLNETALCIPFHHRLSDGDVEKIFDGLKSFTQNKL